MWAQDAGTYYIQNVGTGKWLSPANGWETQASVLNHADKWVLAYVSEGVYTLESVVSNGNGKIYLNGGYCDGATNNLTFAKIAGKDNTYSIKEGTKYYTTDGTTVSATADNADSENAQWKLYTASDLTTAMASATPASGVDATWLILDHNLSRNNRNYSSWSNTGATDPKTSVDNSASVRFSIEAFQTTFDVKQTLTNIPNGLYALQVNGFYRQDGADENLPYVYANGVKTTLPLRSGTENDMQAAAEAFVAGNYLSEPAMVMVTDGSLTIGVATEGTTCWSIFKNFHLTYYGNPTNNITFASLPVSYPMNSTSSAVPFDAGTIVSGSNIKAWSKNTTANTTANATIDSNPWLAGNQPYTLSEDETVTVSFTVFEGWLGSSNTVTVQLLNSNNVSLAEYTYNVNSTNVTDVKFNNNTATGFEAFSGISYYNSTQNANGFNGNGKPYLTNATYNPTVTFTMSDNGYVTFTFESIKAGTKSFNATLPTSGEGSVVMDLASIRVIDNIGNSDRALGINNLSITSAIAPKHTVTFTYEDTEGNSLSALKANSSIQAAEGTRVESLITAALKSSFYNGDASVRYDYSTYTVTGDATTVPEDDITVTLKFASKAKFVHNAQAVDESSNVLKADLASGYAYAGDNLSLHWSKYLYANSQWYETASLFGTYTTAGTSNITFSTSDIDYFFEFEDLNMSGSFAATQRGDDLSNNNSARFAKNSRAWTSAITAGTYTLNIYCFGTNAKTPTLPMYYCDTDGSNMVYIGEATATSANSWALKEKTGIVIPEGKALCFYNTDASNNSNYLVDYFTLTRTSGATIPATITSSSGFATLYTSYALDFSSLSSELKAYTATLEGETVTLTEVANVPANTGVVLKGDVKTHNIPVIASSETAKGSLTGNATEATAYNAFTGYDLYMLAINGDSKAQFMKATSGEIAAGKAFLKVASDAGARSFSVVFANESTGIDSMLNDERIMTKEVYNLNGQRVAAPQKGLYIVNGKKVIIK